MRKPPDLGWFFTQKVSLSPLHRPPQPLFGALGGLFADDDGLGDVVVDALAVRVRPQVVHGYPSQEEDQARIAFESSNWVP